MLFLREKRIYSRKPGFTETLLRPLARRRESTLLPPWVFMRVRKPCVFDRLRRLGWNVRLGMKDSCSSVESTWYGQTTSINDEVPCGQRRLTSIRGYAYRYQGQFTLRGATHASAATHTTPKWSSANFTQACDLNVHHACGSYILAT
jgi:hypothetical protein